MKTIQIALNNKYYTQEISTNTILLKNLTGIGATHYELNCAKRNSIIIEPNVPVIIGKSQGRKDVLGVYEGVTKEQIEKYISNNDIEFKKIVSTPESLKKVIAAFDDLNIDYFNTYFMLIDECEKLIKDIEYRKDIVYPLDIFFKFKNKAFVSATAIIPSDPRFKKNNFVIHNIVPTYDITRDLNVITTNHSLSILNSVLQTTKADKVFIFLNSVNGALRIMKSLKIEAASSLFTSSEKIKDLKNEEKDVNPKHVADMISFDKLSKYNFLTSRYFSAVDIDIEESVEIVIISDIHSFEHSIIDPKTDLLQIIGRLRKKEHVTDITFISRIPTYLKYETQDSIEEIFAFGKQLRDFLKTAKISTDKQDVKDFIDDFIEINGDRVFFNKDYTPNYFMMDNYRYQNQVKSYYQSQEKLIDSIKNHCIPNTDINYFNVTHKVETFNTDLCDLKLKNINGRFKDEFENIIQRMETIQKLKEERTENLYQIDNMDELETGIFRKYMEMYEIFLNEGADKLREIGKSHKAIKEYYYLNYDFSHLKNVPLIQELYKEFKIDKEYDQKDFLDRFHEIFKKHDNNAVRKIQDVNRFFQIKEFRKRIKGDSNQKRMITIVKYKFEVTPKN